MSMVKWGILCIRLISSMVFRDLTELFTLRINDEESDGHDYTKVNLYILRTQDQIHTSIGRLTPLSRYEEDRVCY